MRGRKSFWGKEGGSFVLSENSGKGNLLQRCKGVARFGLPRYSVRPHEERCVCLAPSYSPFKTQLEGRREKFTCLSFSFPGLAYSAVPSLSLEDLWAGHGVYDEPKERLHLRVDKLNALALFSHFSGAPNRICSEDLLSPTIFGSKYDEKLEFFFCSNFREMGNIYIMPVVFGEIRMSFWVRKKASYCSIFGGATATRKFGY